MITAPYDSSVWLNFLKCDGFYIEPLVAPRVYNLIGLLPVTYLDGTKKPLKETILPTADLMLACQKFRVGFMPLIRVENPADPGWPRYLDQLSVVTKIDVTFFTRVLLYFNHQGIDERVRVEEVYNVFMSLGNKVDARSEFLKYPFIYLPFLQKAQWVNSSACVWRSPQGYRGKVALFEQWHEQEEFLRTMLSIKNVDLDIVIADIKMHSQSLQRIDLGYLKDLLLMLPRFSKTQMYSQGIKGLADLPIFPVCGMWVLTAVESWASFFVADREDLQRCFWDRVLQLDFPVADIHKLQQGQVFSLLNMERKLLSNIVEEVSKPLGD